MRVRPAGLVPAVVLATGMWSAGPAAAAGVTLQYTCTLAGLPSQPMTAQVVWQAPTSVVVGRPTPTVTVLVTATVGAEVTFGLQVVGAATVEGSVDAPGVVAAPEGHIATALRLTVQRTGVPSGGPMTVLASGTTPGLVFHQPGHATVTVDSDLALHFTPRNASGGLTAAGSVDLSCTLNPGQNTTVFAFDIAPAPVAVPTTRAPVPNHPSSTPAVVPPAPTPATTTAVSTTTQPATTSPTATSATINGLATATAVVRTVGPAGVNRWLAIAGTVVLAGGALGFAWWLIRRRQH